MRRHVVQVAVKGAPGHRELGRGWMPRILQVASSGFRLERSIDIKRKIMRRGGEEGVVYELASLKVRRRRDDGEELRKICERIVCVCAWTPGTSSDLCRNSWE